MTDENERERLMREGGGNRVIRKMEELLEYPDTKDAGLQEAEVLALQLYTGIKWPLSLIHDIVIVVLLVQT